MSHVMVGLCAMSHVMVRPRSVSHVNGPSENFPGLGVFGNRLEGFSVRFGRALGGRGGWDRRGATISRDSPCVRFDAHGDQVWQKKSSLDISLRFQCRRESKSDSAQGYGRAYSCNGLVRGVPRLAIAYDLA